MLDRKKQFDAGNKRSELTQTSVITRCASDIIIKPIDWLWFNRFARGKLSLIAGEPGLGKSQTIISMTGIITTGKTWPDGAQCQLGSVIFLSAEDDAADTITPRLIAAGADLTRVHIVDNVRVADNLGNETLEYFNLGDDLAALERKIIEIGDVAAIFIDPVSAYLGGRIDEYKNAAIRSLLTPLSKFSEKYNIAVICITHLNKNETQSAINRISGSIGYVAAARVVFVVIRV